MGLRELAGRYGEALDREMKRALGEWEGGLYRMLRYHLGWLDENGRPARNGGKALRPILCLLSSEAVGGDWRRAVSLAASMELIHNFSLIHDDIQDGDRERRHRPTVWALWGKPQAINAGTAMWVLAQRVSLGAGEITAQPCSSLEAYRVLDAATLEMIEGQFLDLSFEGRMDIDVPQYLDMVRRKTGVLMGCSLQLGALAGGAGLEEQQAFRKCGLHLGQAYQIIDDFLGIWGAPEITGKPQASDLLRRKKSFPVAYALEHSTDRNRDELVALYLREDWMDDEKGRVLELLEEAGAKASTYQWAERECRLALDDLEGLSMAPWARRQFDEVAEFFIGRDK